MADLNLDKVKEEVKDDDDEQPEFNFDLPERQPQQTNMQD